MCVPPWQPTINCLISGIRSTEIVKSSTEALFKPSDTFGSSFLLSTLIPKNTTGWGKAIWAYGVETLASATVSFVSKASTLVITAMSPATTSLAGRISLPLGVPKGPTLTLTCLLTFYMSVLATNFPPLTNA